MNGMNQKIPQGINMCGVDKIEQIIYRIRGNSVMLDRDLANLYCVSTKRLNEQVRRNIDRFPEDFAFQLSSEEFKNWKSQFATSNPSIKMGLRKRPYVFTEYGAVMLANVLRSKHAIRMSIEVVRTFIQLRQALATQEKITKAIIELRDFVLKRSNKTDKEFYKVWAAIEKLAHQTHDDSPPIGFKI